MRVVGASVPLARKEVLKLPQVPRDLPLDESISVLCRVDGDLARFCNEHPDAKLVISKMSEE